MKTRSASALVIAVALTGCASGGGGGGSGEDFPCALVAITCVFQAIALASKKAAAVPLTAEEIAERNDPCNSLGSIVAGFAGASCSESGSTSSSLNGSAGRSSSGSGAGSTPAAAQPALAGPPSGYVRMDMYYEPNVLGSIGRTEFSSEEWSARMGIPDPGYQGSYSPDDPKAVNPFVANTRGNAGVEAYARDTGLQYQSFGVWNRHIGYNGEILAWSSGALTPASAVPTAGTATFTGKLIGLYVSPAGQGSMGSAEVVVNANFSERSLSFSSSGTRTTRDNATFTAAPNLNLSGTLAYSTASRSFSGTLTNAGGTMNGTSKGQYYGPAAQELGGVFTMHADRGPETFAGAYGAKR